MSERRKSSRSRTLLAANAMTGSLSAVDCHVANVSEGGAKLVVDGEGHLPDDFQLKLPAKGVSHRANVRWRAPGAVGVKFQTEPKEAIGDEANVRIRALEKEVATLRARCADLTRRLELSGSTDTSAF